jgi:hypothetical protein
MTSLCQKTTEGQAIGGGASALPQDNSMSPTSDNSKVDSVSLPQIDQLRYSRRKSLLVDQLLILAEGGDR